MPTVRCADCGFLAVRDLQTNELIEVKEDGRKRWVLPAFPGGSQLGPMPVVRRCDETPLCAVGAYPLGEEAKGREADAVLPVITRDRKCRKFTRWRREYTPKEHYQMFAADQLQQDNRRWQVILALVAPVVGVVNLLLGAYIVRPPQSPPPPQPAPIVQPIIIQMPADPKDAPKAVAPPVKAP
jgi:hypothetical protein